MKDASNGQQWMASKIHVLQQYFAWKKDFNNTKKIRPILRVNVQDTLCLYEAMKGSYPRNCVIAMGETDVWLDMIGNATFSAIGAKEIPLKLTGNEQKRISVCLTAKPD